MGARHMGGGGGGAQGTKIRTEDGNLGFDGKGSKKNPANSNFRLVSFIALCHPSSSSRSMPACTLVKFDDGIDDGTDSGCVSSCVSGTKDSDSGPMIRRRTRRDWSRDRPRSRYDRTTAPGNWNAVTLRCPSLEVAVLEKLPCRSGGTGLLNGGEPPMIGPSSARRSV